MTTMNSITNINPAIFLATAMFAADKNEVRYFLQGVLVERAQGGGLLYTATNGHVLLHAHDVNAEMDGPSPRVVEAGNIKFTSTWWKALSLTHQGDGNTATLKTLGTARPQLAAAPTIEGYFPDYTKVIPSSSPSGESAQFDTKYVHLFQAAAEKANFGRPYIHYNGENSALVTFQSAEAPAAVGVILPLSNPKKVVLAPTLPKAQND